MNRPKILSRYCLVGTPVSKSIRSGISLCSTRMLFLIRKINQCSDCVIIYRYPTQRTTECAISGALKLQTKILRKS